jgi:hypothetical protein
MTDSEAVDAHDQLQWQWQLDFGYRGGHFKRQTVLILI